MILINAKNTFRGIRWETRWTCLPPIVATAYVIDLRETQIKTNPLCVWVKLPCILTLEVIFLLLFKHTTLCWCNTYWDGKSSFVSLKCWRNYQIAFFVWFYIVPPIEDCKEQEPIMDNNISLVPFERPAVIEKLTGNMGKRKSSTPQKFVGKHDKCFYFFKRWF